LELKGSDSDIILPRKNKKVNESMDKYRLTDAEHQQIMEAWRTTYVPYRKLLERYETYLKSIATYNRKKNSSQAFKVPAKLSHWIPKDRENSKQELRMQRPTRTVRVSLLSIAIH
jgi:hypothetical protein